MKIFLLGMVCILMMVACAPGAPGENAGRVRGSFAIPDYIIAEKKLGQESAIIDLSLNNNSEDLIKIERLSITCGCISYDPGSVPEILPGHAAKVPLFISYENITENSKKKIDVVYLRRTPTGEERHEKKTFGVEIRVDKVLHVDQSSLVWSQYTDEKTKSVNLVGATKAIQGIEIISKSSFFEETLKAEGDKWSLTVRPQVPQIDEFFKAHQEERILEWMVLRISFGEDVVERRKILLIYDVKTPRAVP